MKKNLEPEPEQPPVRHHLSSREEGNGDAPGWEADPHHPDPSPEKPWLLDSAYTSRLLRKMADEAENNRCRRPTFSHSDAKELRMKLDQREPDTIWRVWKHYLRTRKKRNAASIKWFLQDYEAHESRALKEE